MIGALMHWVLKTLNEHLKVRRSMACALLTLYLIDYHCFIDYYFLYCPTLNRVHAFFFISTGISELRVAGA